MVVLTGSIDSRWVQNRFVDSPLYFHFDADQVLSHQDPHVWKFPDISTIFYLDDIGGPTLILNQRMCMNNESDLEALVPPRATQGYLVYPEANQYAMFRGNLLHGVLNAKMLNMNFPPEKKRTTLLINWWKQHKPLSPACIEPHPTFLSSVQNFVIDSSNYLMNHFFQANNGTQEEEEEISVENSVKVPIASLPVPPSLLHKLDLQLGLHSSVEIWVKLPKEFPGAPGAYYLFPGGDQDPHPRPLLDLLIPIKDKAEITALSIPSWKKFIHSFTVVDFESSDGSPETINFQLYGIPGKIYTVPVGSDPWEYANKEARFVLAMNPDWSLRHGEKFLETLEKLWESGNTLEGGYALQVHQPGGEDSVSESVLRPNAVGGKTIKELPKETIPLNGTFIKTSPKINRLGIGKYSEEDKEEWREDIKESESELLKDPENGLLVFRLANLYNWIGEKRISADYFQKFVKIQAE